MPGMGIGQYMIQRQEMRLMQLLEQVQVLTSEKDVEEQKEIVQKFVNELASGTYCTVDDFYDRCMKRIKISRRTDGAQSKNNHF